jgi:serine/threonine protein phosphatase 1
VSTRTFVFGDIHGETAHLERLLARLPALTASDTLVFLGDALNRGPDSKGTIDLLRRLPLSCPAQIVCLRGNHEDAWLRVRREGWDAFVLPPAHGCLACYRSFAGGKFPAPAEVATHEEMAHLCAGDFFPPEVVAWMEALPYWYEDEHGIYVHAGLPRAEKGFSHPSEVSNQRVLAWMRTDEFVRTYSGKNVFFGHTPTSFLPQELSLNTPEDPNDAYVTEDCFGLDTGCGMGGFLTAMELPAMTIYESR